MLTAIMAENTVFIPTYTIIQNKLEFISNSQLGKNRKGCLSRYMVYVFGLGLDWVSAMMSQLQQS